MNIRYRITLWITLTGVFASLVLSFVIFFELMEESYELLDHELEANAVALSRNFEILQRGSFSNHETDILYSPYWVKVIDDDQHLVYASEVAQQLELPLKKIPEGYVVNTKLLLNKFLTTPEEDEGELATFRVRVFEYSISRKEYVIQIARPIENIDKERIELVAIIGLGLLISALLLVLTSYYVSGRILSPIKKINATVGEFTEKTLDRRITLGKVKDEIYHLSSALNAMFDRLQYSFVHQKEFIANASHELKTPLTLLRIFIAESLTDPELPETLRKNLEKQHKTVLRMDRLVKNLLSLSSLELSKAPPPQTFILNELVDTIIEDFQPLMEERNIQFFSTSDEKITVIADKDLIKRIFINLFENAVSYNKKWGEIRLKMWRSKQDGVQIDLFNTGHGIPPGDYERVFEQFYRVEKSRATALGGVGLGLTITKKIVDLYGGTISVTSQPGNWTQFHLALPILKPMITITQ